MIGDDSAASRKRVAWIAAAAPIPAEVTTGVRRLLSVLGLSFGVLDFRVRDSDGVWHFLEVNPAGRWLGLEERAGLLVFLNFAFWDVMRDDPYVAELRRKVGLPAPR